MVLVLEAVRQSANNFPPCPMCRAPITRAINDIDLMEPARAEEDIIEFVRPYENCDLCKKTSGKHVHEKYSPLNPTFI